MKGAAIVTGGSKGIGRAIANSLRKEGYSVAIVYHSDDEAAKRVEKECGAKSYKFDVADYAACEKGVAKIVKDMGPVTILVNNAGITKDGMLHKMDPTKWHAVVETNLTSCFNMCRVVIEAMREQKYGRIINISSINGQKGQFGQTNYSAAKAGILGFTKALALESASKGVTVNAVCPGYIETSMTAEISHDVLQSIVQQIPVGHLGQPQNIADLVTYLASEKASFITGSTITANGGQYMV